jgi:hypothetical protein
VNPKDHDHLNSIVIRQKKIIKKETTEIQVVSKNDSEFIKEASQ